MATQQIYLKGKGKYIRTEKPDPKYGNYSATLYPDDESMIIVRELIESKPGILNELKQDEDGYFIKFNCKPNQRIGGKDQIFNVEVLNADGTPCRQLIGNGSDVTLKLDVYTYRRGEGKAARLRAVRVDNLIPYEPKRDFSEDQKGTVAGLMEQPKPVF